MTWEKGRENTGKHNNRVPFSKTLDEHSPTTRSCGWSLFVCVFVYELPELSAHDHALPPDSL